MPDNGQLARSKRKKNTSLARILCCGAELATSIIFMFFVARGGEKVACFIQNIVAEPIKVKRAVEPRAN